jgi:GDP-4-dehydro-6-deoxy-D-mannose reductase
MNYLITGITGFAGPHLANKLIQEGHNVYGMYRSGGRNHTDIQDILGYNINKLKFINSDLQNTNEIYDLFKNNKFDGVFHLGAATHPPTSFNQPELYFRINALGTVAICEAIRKYSPECILMQCSTSEVYGVCSGDIPINEDFPMKPMNPYAVSKAAADMYVMERTRNNMIRAFFTRAFSHTGPRRFSNYSISSDAIQIARILLKKQDNHIKVGNLKAKRVVMDVRDVVDVYYKLMKKMEDNSIPNGEIFNISGNKLFEIQHYLDLMIEMFCPIKPELIIDPTLYRPIDIPIQYPDSNKVRILLGWEPTIDIETTLRDLVEYWLKYEWREKNEC